MIGSDISRRAKFAERPAVQMLVLLLLLFMRSYPRLLHPQVWVEDATPSFRGSNILDFVTYGASAFIHPVNGYLLLLPKVISWISLKISFSCYAAVSTVLAWLAIVLCGFVLGVGKTQLRGGLLVAILPFLVPSDPEVFGLPSYTFWWASLALFAAALWRDDASDLRWRLPIITLAGLSSPAIVAVVPLLMFRAIALRNRWQEWLVTLLGTICAAVQMFVYRASGVPNSHVSVKLRVMLQVVPQFLGRYLVGNLVKGVSAYWVAGLMLLTFTILMVMTLRKVVLVWELAFLFAAFIGITAYRVDLRILNPATAGPRYFFFPFVLISWFLLQVVFSQVPAHLRMVAALLLLVSIVNMLPVRTRSHDDLHWQQHAISCPYFEHYSIPVEYDGHAARAWQLQLTGEQCRNLMHHDRLRKLSSTILPFPYTTSTFPLQSTDAHLASVYSVIGNANGVTTNYFDHTLRVISSGTATYAHQHPILVRLDRGEAVLYWSHSQREGRIALNGGALPFASVLPVTGGWKALEFSNSALPNEFIVTFQDTNEWFTLGLENRE